MKIRTRILLIVVVLVSLMFFAQIYVSKALARLGDEVHKIADLSIPANEAISRIANLQLKQSYNFERVLRFAVLGKNSQNTNLEGINDFSKIDKIPLFETKAQFEKINLDIKLALNDISSEKFLQQYKEDQELKTLLETHKDKITVAYSKYEVSTNKIIKLINEEKYKEANELLFLEPLEISEANLRTCIENALLDIHSNAKKTTQTVNIKYKQAIESLFFITFITLIIGIFLAYLISRSITKPLAKAVDFAEKIANNQAVTPISDSEESEIGILLRSLSDMNDSVKLSEKKLAERAKELAKSNKELEQFAYVASHDLQEPLRMVASYVQLLEKKYKGKLDSDADEFIFFAVDGAVRMKTLINDLLEYSRVGRKELHKTPVSTEQVLKKTLINLKEATNEKHAKITWETLPTVKGDETQLIQLFQNLIANAIKFCKVSPPCVHISASKKLSKDGRSLWEFSFKDNGIGIDETSKERIFQIFQRLHTRKEYPGTGIGLSICKKIVERHGGTLSVESKVGIGSVFKFDLES